ncbi:MAG TPA: alpha-2-macroglobulin family protein [Trichormus sp.]
MKCDRFQYNIGEEAHVSIKSSIKSARGMLFVSNLGVLKTIPVSIAEGEAQLTLPITDACLSQVTLSLTVPVPNEAPLAAVTSIQVLPSPHGIALELKPAVAVTEPRATTSFDVKATSSDGKPVADAQVAVAVVDDNILALSDFRWHDPLAVFYESSGGTYEPLNSAQTLIPLVPARRQLAAFGGQTGQLAALSSVDRYGFFGPRDTNMFQVEPTMVDERHYTSGRDERHQRFNTAIPSVPRREKSIELRSDLNPLAYFNPNVRTDTNGQAHVEFKLPDNVTRYRIMAVAATKSGDFGSASSEFATRLALTVRPTPPRFLHEGDRCEFPVILQNETEQPMSTDVIVRADNLDLVPSASLAVLSSDGGPVAGTHIQVPAKDRVEVHFQAASRKSGIATLQFAAVAGNRRDATEASLPVTSPLEDECFAAYGEIDQDTVEQQEIGIPSTIASDVGGFEAQLSSTAMTELEDSAKYLQNYPYECSEQISSRLLALLGLRQLSNQFPAAQLIDVTAADAQIKADLTKLCLRQKSGSGEFCLWDKDDNGVYPYVSIQAVRALHLASDAGYFVSPDALDTGDQYLFSVQNREFPSYSWSETYAIRAYALSVLHSCKPNLPITSQARQLLDLIRRQFDQVDHEAARRLYATANDPTYSHEKDADPDVHTILRDSLSLEGMCWLLPSLTSDPDEKADAQAIREIISQHIVESASNAEVQDDPYESGGFHLFYSNVRMQAVVLETLMQDQPTSPIITKLLRGLLLARKNGIWSNTQENGYALLALSKYFSSYEKVEPDFVADLWLGSTQAAHERFSGRAIASSTIAVPMNYLVQHKEDKAVILRKSGNGRLYYRLGLKYAYSNPYVQKRARGIEVEREYEAIDDQSDVVRLPDGTWQVRAGVTFRVRIKFATPATRHYVAMVDPTAGGLELLNTELRGTRSLPASFQRRPIGRNAWWFAGFDHFENRDQGLRAFADTLQPGQYEYSYPVRATSPGTYIIPACKMEEMYSPETFGHSSASKMIIVSDERKH